MTLEGKVFNMLETSDLYQTLPPDSYSRLVTGWKAGNIPSHDMLPVVLGRFISADHKIGSVFLKDIPHSEIIDAARESTILPDFYSLGLQGQNPPPELAAKYFRFLPGISNLIERTELDRTANYSPVTFPPFSLVDKQLPGSLLAHAFLAYKRPDLYAHNEEVFYFNHIFQAVKSTAPDDKEVWTITPWLFLDQLLSFSRRLKVMSLLELKAFDKDRSQYLFDNIEHFLHRLIPLAYLSGWEDRLTPELKKLANSLPQFMDAPLARQVVSSAFYLRHDKSNFYLEDFIRRLKSGEKPSEIAVTLLQLNDRAIEKNKGGLLRTWEILALQGQPSAPAIDQIITSEIVSRSPEEARNLITGFNLLFQGTIRDLGFDPQCQLLRIIASSRDGQKLRFTMAYGTILYQLLPLPEKILARDVSKEGINPVELTRAKAYQILSHALLPSLAGTSGSEWKLEGITQVKPNPCS